MENYSIKILYNDGTEKITIECSTPRRAIFIVNCVAEQLRQDGYCVVFHHEDDYVRRVCHIVMTAY